jgi:hypothetical protein
MLKTKLGPGEYEVEAGGRVFYVRKIDNTAWTVDARDREGILPPEYASTVRFLRSHHVDCLCTLREAIEVIGYCVGVAPEPVALPPKADPRTTAERYCAEVSNCARALNRRQIRDLQRYRVAPDLMVLEPPLFRTDADGITQRTRFADDVLMICDMFDRATEAAS